MNKTYRKDNLDQCTGYLGTSRVVLNHFDVSTQADIQHVALSYESEDEMMGRKSRRSGNTAHYSKQDIREQYCISDRGLGALESDKHSLFGCLSSHHNSPCNRSNFLTACVRQKVPSDENIYELYRRHPNDYAPYPRRNRYPWAPVTPEMRRYDEDLKSSYFRRKPVSDPSRYTWMTSDDESIRMEKPRSILEPYPPSQITPPPSVPPGKKHVSFARSHTLNSFDDAISTLSSSSSHINRMTRSQERLLDVRKAEGAAPITRQPESENVVILDKIKRTPMKTQATQTEACLGRRPLPPSNINLSPRTINRVKMVSQGAQTNGFVVNGRKLIKSYSESGSKYSLHPKYDFPQQFEPILDHEPLTRTQSDEPPRSPFIVTTPPPPMLLEEPPPPIIPSDTSSLSRSDKEDSDSNESKKEIFIDFKPQVASAQHVKRPLTKAVSDGEILVEQRKTLKTDDSVVPDKHTTSISHENIISNEEEQRSFTPYFQKSPIRHEGICKPLIETAYSSLEGQLYAQDSIDEEFHENLIYNPLNLGVSPEESVVPICSLSPFASNDSLSNDFRDQSDGIWNESQATVLQVDSGTDNGTALSSSEMTSVTSPSVAVLTPSSRRRHLLMMQHQQRSSMDTEALDEEFLDQDVYPRIIVEKPSSKQLEVPSGLGVERGSRQFLQTQVWRRRVPESPAESPQPAIVPDLILSRTDSGKTNTDMSESTTTDDYITANSGTDSSRRSGSIMGMDLYNRQANLNDGSSFDSIKGIEVLDDMVVPSYSPLRSICNTPVPQKRSGRVTPSDDSSSSCGSYSVGSTPDLLDRSAVPSGSSERSIHYSSGYYESPMEDDLTWKSKQEDAPKKRPYTLEISKHSSEPNGKHKTKPKSSPSEALKPNDKPKRTKARTRSPMQTHKKKPQFPDPKITSDESSCEFAHQKTLIQTSPRKSKKSKENNRRKSLPRSPVAQRSSKRDQEEKPSSLPGSLSRRRSSKQPKPPQPEDIAMKLSPSKIKSPDSTKLKALSAESLRSVSPGSDSVFYSDPSSHTGDHQVHCLHCGKEVDIVTTEDPEKVEGGSSGNGTQDIVQPPAGFEDSPILKPGSRLYRKLDRRIKSEDRLQAEQRRRIYKPDARAKSEERGAAKSCKSKLRPMAKSTNNSQEVLKATDSSPSVLPGEPEDEDDQGVYDAAYVESSWIFVDECEEVQAWNKSFQTDQEQASRRTSISSTESEQEFRKRYQAITHRMVHRRSCLEMYKRQSSKSFECDKKVIVHRESGEFGFRIHGSKPVVVSAIEPGTPAETSGLEVGDIVLAVNGISVLDKSHSEVVKIAHAGSDTLTLDVARTCYALNPVQDELTPNALYSGYLWKLSGYASGSPTNKWIRRWFALKENNCLYCYKTDSEKQPVAAIMLFDHQVLKISDNDGGYSKPNRFLIQKDDSVPLQLAADTPTARGRWIEVLSKAINDCQIVDEFLEDTKRKMLMPPGSILNPDCFGYLVKLGNQWKSWSRRYCVLKNACLYFYQDANAKCAFGVAYLHGYRVQQTVSGSKKHAFEILPPDAGKKRFYFHTESDADRKRWLAALEYSIDRWFKVQ